MRLSNSVFSVLAVAETPAAAPGGMWALSLPWWEFIVRGVIAYAFLLILIRITGKRQIGQLAPFDLVLLLVLSTAVQNAMNGGDNSVGGGLISAVTLVLLNYGIGMATYRSKVLEALIEGRPDVIIHNGTLYPAVMRRAKLTHHELNAALRQAGCACIRRCDPAPFRHAQTPPPPRTFCPPSHSARTRLRCRRLRCDRRWCRGCRTKGETAKGDPK